MKKGKQILRTNNFFQMIFSFMHLFFANLNFQNKKKNSLMLNEIYINLDDIKIFIEI